jgi:hypothetical protein
MREKKFLLPLLIITSILIVFTASEVALRFAGYKYLVRRRYGFPAYLFVNDSEMGTDLSTEFSSGVHEFADYEYEVFTNSLGCFDKEIDRANFRDNGYALLVGDSFAWGYAPFDCKFGTIMEKLLRFNIAKCGITGHGTKQELIKAKRVISKIGFPPRLIIVAYTADNDFNDDYLMPWSTVIKGDRINTIGEVDLKNGRVLRLDERELKARYERYRKSLSHDSLKSYLKGHSIIYKLYRKAVRKLENAEVSNRGEDRENLILQKEKFYGHYGFNLMKLYEYRDRFKWVEEAFNEHLSNLLAFKELSESLDAGLLVLIIDENETDGEALDIIKRTLRENEIAYIDLNASFRKFLSNGELKDLQWEHDAHWNIQGNYIVGLIVSKFILENHMLPVYDEEKKLELVNDEISKFND